MKLRKFSIGRIFYNDKFVVAFSIFASIILWVVMATTNTEDRPHDIPNVPITIKLSDAAQEEGLKVFSPVNAMATVSIKGNSLIVNQVKAADLVVVAKLASTITMPGNYSVDLSVEKKGNLTDFEATVFPSQIIISVDRYKEKTFSIENDITYKSDYRSDLSYFVNTPVFSSETVTISGPEKEISQVNRVSVSYEISETLRETKNFTANLIMYDANGNKIVSDKLKMNPDKVDVSIPVLARKILPVSPSFTNKPLGLTFAANQISINPQSIEVAGPADVLANLTNISLAPLDFSSVSPTKNAFDLDVALPASCKNLSSIPVAKVTLDLSSFTTRKLVVNNFTVKNLAADKTSDVYTKNLAVTVVGPDSEISKLTESNITAQVDMSGKENFTGHTEMPVTFSISNASSSWVYGSYMANISVSAK